MIYIHQESLLTIPCYLASCGRVNSYNLNLGSQATLSKKCTNYRVWYHVYQKLAQKIGCDLRDFSLCSVKVFI